MRLLLVWVFAAVSALLAQDNSGTILGTVRDAQDAVVPSATVTVTHIETGVVRAMRVSSSGRYAAALLPPGTYSVSAEAPGFKRTLQEAIPLRVSDQLVIDVRLTVGAVAESITVHATAPLLESASVSLGQVVESKQILDLPLNGRDAVSLAGLAPGVVPQDPAPGAAVQIGNNVPGINGANYGMSGVTVDGTSNSTPRGTSYMMIYSPNVDSVAEFKVQTNSMSAEFGRTNGGSISIITKSGTNQFHGTAYWFLRNKVFDANDFFSNAAGIPLAALQRNQAGGTLGGPVRRDKTFFFTDYEAYREKVGNPLSFTVPTALERSGDFSKTFNSAGKQVLIFDPLNTTTLANGNTQRKQFPGNIIPASRLDPVAGKLMAFYPLPTTNALTGNLPLNTPRRNTNDTFNIRLDQYVGAHRLFARGVYQQPWVGEPNYFNNIGNSSTPPLEQRRRTASLQDVYTISPTLLANINFSITYQYGRRVAWSLGYDITKLGFPTNFRDGQEVAAIPLVTVSSYTGLGTGSNSYSTQTVPMAEFGLTKIFNRHRLKTGFEYRAFYNNQLQNTNLQGSFTFNPAFTQGPDPNTANAAAGSSISSMLLGLPASGSITNQPATAFRSSYRGLYVQDDYTVARNVTLFLGLRWDENVPRTERYDRMTVLDLSQASPIAAQVPSLHLVGQMQLRTGDQRHLFDPQLNSFGPRAGLAWQVQRNTVLRAAYGLFYGLSSADATLSTAFQDGFSSTTNIITSLNDVNPFQTLSNPYPNGIRPPVTKESLGPALNIGQATSSALLSLASGQFQQWNFTLQHVVRSNLLLEAAYAGNKGSHISTANVALNTLTADQLALGTYVQQVISNPFYGVITDPTSALSKTTIARRQLMYPYPQYSTISSEAPSLGSSIYHSLQAKAQHRMGHGVNLLVSYTLAKTLTNVTGAGIPDPNNMKAERSVPTWDVGQRLVLSGLWELPFGKGRILGHWQWNGIMALQSGFPLALTSTGAVRPDRIRPVLAFGGPIQQRLNQYFDTGAFAIPKAFTYGNAPPTEPDVRGPGTANYDMSLLKSFRLRERLNAQFRFEGFNVFNRVRFANPGTQNGTNSFGVITAQQNQPRKLQVALKLVF